MYNDCDVITPTKLFYVYLLKTVQWKERATLDILFFSVLNLKRALFIPSD